MKRKKKKLKKIKSIKSKKSRSKKSTKRGKKIIQRKSRIKRIFKKKGKKTKSRKKKKFIPSKFKNKKTQKTRAVVSGILSLSDKLRSMLRFNFNLDKSLQKFFQGISNRVSNIKKVIQEEREKQKKLKFKQCRERK